MPSTSQAQQRLMAIAEHHPEKVRKENRGVLKMSGQQLHDFASTPRKGLPPRRVYGEDGMPAVEGRPEHGAEGHDTYRARSGGQVLVDRPGHEWHEIKGGVVERAGELPKSYLEDGGHWMQGAVKRPGALTRKANRVGESPMTFARKHYHDSGLTGEQARFAVNAQK